jgi:hypothetical protein
MLMGKFIEKIHIRETLYKDVGHQPERPLQFFAVVAPAKVPPSLEAASVYLNNYKYPVKYEEQHYYVWVCTRRKVMASNTIKEWGYYVCFRYWAPLFPYDYINLSKEVEIEVKHEEGDTPENPDFFSPDLPDY